MSWTYHTGVQENFTSTVITGASNNTQTNVDQITTGAIRMIWAINEHNQARTHCQMIRNHGKVPIPTLDFNSTTVPPAAFITACQQYAAALEGIVPMIELGNEPPGEWHAGQVEWRADGTGPFFDRIRDACNAPNSFQDKGIQVVMGTPPLGTNKDKAMLTAANLNRPALPSIWELIDGITLHPYSSNPGSAASPLSTSNPGEGTQLGWVWNRRKQLNAFANPASDLIDIWITEFGWGNERPGTSPPNLLTAPQTGTDPADKAAREANLQTKLVQAYTNWETHCEELRLRAACWFWLRDYVSTAGPSSTMPIVFRNCGLRTDGPGWHWKNGGTQSGGGVHTALAAFGTGITTTGGTAPDAVTLTPPSPIAQTSATLRGTIDPNDLQTTWYFQYSRNPLPAIDPLAEPVGFTPRTNAQAAALVVPHPAEERPQNVENAAMPASGTLTAWRAAFTSTALSHYKANVNGQYTGTTDEIIQWAARKWGFHPDILRAVAVKESDWDQGQLGDPQVTTALAASCTMPGDTTITVADKDAIQAEPIEPILKVGTGHDYMEWAGVATGPERFTGCTPHARFGPGSGTVANGQEVRGAFASYGLFQMKRPFAYTTTHIALPRDHSAFVADFYGQILRGYFNGLETWLSAYDPPTGPNTQAYESNDLWGSIGAWYSGRWWDAAAQGYIDSVQAILAARTWEGF